MRHTIEGFIRVLGLMPVVVGRGESFTAAWGTNLQREQLVNLLSRRLRPSQARARRVAHHVRRVLTAGDAARHFRS